MNLKNVLTNYDRYLCSLDILTVTIIRKGHKYNSLALKYNRPNENRS